MGHAHTLGYACPCLLLHTLSDATTVKIMAQRALQERSSASSCFDFDRPGIPRLVGRRSATFAEGIAKLEEQSDFAHGAASLLAAAYLCWLGEAYVNADKPMEAKPASTRRTKSWGEAANIGRGRMPADRGAPRCTSTTNDPAKLKSASSRLWPQRPTRTKGLCLQPRTPLAVHSSSKGWSERARELLQGELRFFADQPDWG